ncbi:unnamed protein product [Rodentolepis nana]|uniref:Ovule protein n=1 Tax=Rodentolepis nana TaxID=102285 RepID=A0A0R3TPN0_RODNA|nr:unnamed protein product [Rodentolepis nana]
MASYHHDFDTHELQSDYSLSLVTPCTFYLTTHSQVTPCTFYLATNSQVTPCTIYLNNGELQVEF